MPPGPQGAGWGHRPGFRWRAGEVTRIEGFSDAVFGFALTLLVVSLEVPRTYGELVRALRGFMGFGICFAVLIQIWRRHYLFFRRYGLQDQVTVALNAVLLFVVLAYVYPLKFVFTLLVGQVTGDVSDVPLPGGGTAPPLLASDAPNLMAIYGVGFALVYGVFTSLYLWALRRRSWLELTALEVFDTRADALDHALYAGVGILSVILALGLRSPAAAGFSFFLIGVAEAVHGAISGRRRRALEAAAAPGDGGAGI